jgi:23S rRNA (guanine2445-N2)-methyltransferase / 23S rRNA (guanine2069-N7)-methyltransferase
VRWLSACRETFDLIYLDPPSFSNSKRTPTVFDVQRDHVALIEAAMARLTSGGVLYFVCNLRRFQLHEDITQRYRVEDRSAPSIPPDFARTPKIHRAYRIQAR